MRVVVDLGCASHEEEVSVTRLMNEFTPDIYYGFDPWPELVEVDLPDVKIVRQAAWIYDGVQRLGTGSFRDWDATVLTDNRDRGKWSQTVEVECFNFGDFLETIVGPGTQVIVKMDVEGAEFALLEGMIDRGLDKEINLLLVEWHDHLLYPREAYTELREYLLRNLSCQVSPW